MEKNKLLMRKLFIFFFMAAAILKSQFVLATVATTDRVAAIVNAQIITMHELNQRLQMVKRNLVRQKIAAPPDHILKEQVLDRMIQDLVQVEAAEKMGLKVENAEIDHHIAEMAKQRHKTVAELRQTLQKDGEDFTSFRNQIRQEILINLIRDQEIARLVHVSDAEIDDWLHHQSPHKQNEYELAQVLISLPENPSQAQLGETQKKISNIERDLANGANFAAIAAKYSGAKEAMRGGKIGWRKGSTLPSRFTVLLDQLPIGSITEPIRTPLGIHIFKLLDKRTAQKDALVTQTHARHILIRTTEFVSLDDALKQARDIENRLHHGANFAEMARIYSADGTAAKGGDLGWVNPGQMVAEFQNAMDKLKPEQISSPIKTQFGVHIIQVLGRRQHDIGPERERMQVRMEIFQRKAEEAYHNWVSQLYNSAYIDKRINE